MDEPNKVEQESSSDEQLPDKIPFNVNRSVRNYGDPEPPLPFNVRKPTTNKPYQSHTTANVGKKIAPMYGQNATMIQRWKKSPMNGFAQNCLTTLPTMFRIITGLPRCSISEEILVWFRSGEGKMGKREVSVHH